MTAPRPRKKHRPYRTTVLYWATQVSGWGFYMGFLWLYNFIMGSANLDLLKMLGAGFLIGVGTSHLFRALILRSRWLERPIGHVLPRSTLGAVTLGIVAFLAEAILHDLLFTDYPPLLSKPFVDLLGIALNWVALLFMWSLAYFAYTYFLRHRREEIRNLRLESINRENQLNNLRAQLNPHFMFNALNGIRALIDEDPEQAKRSITLLSAILRNAMATVKRRVVPLGEEIDIVKAYLGLEAMRYEERLRVRFEIEPGIDRIPVPPMLLQTLVENAVRHGVARSPHGGDVVIGAQRGFECIVLSVRNTGHYEPGRINGTGIGLQNTLKRLEMTYGGKASISIMNRDGMVVTEVEIPLHPQHSDTP
jgi:two-component system, LytTR family, sensor kinase